MPPDEVKPSFLVLKFSEPFTPELRLPADKPTRPFRPCSTPFFNTMLMIPAVPSPSYLAGGVVMISTDLICSAGMPFSASARLLASVGEGLLLTRTLKLPEPRIFTLPSPSTVSRGALRSTSAAVPPALVASWSALYTMRSGRISTTGFVPITTASARAVPATGSRNVPASAAPAVMVTLRVWVA